MIPAGIEQATFRFVTQHPNHCATAVPLLELDPSKYDSSFSEYLCNSSTKCGNLYILQFYMAN